MKGNMYWITTLLFFVIQLIILFKASSSRTSDKLEKSFRRLISWVTFFFLQDALWGMCNAHIIKNDTLFFISSQIFHISTIITACFWLAYILAFLGVKTRLKKFFIMLEILISVTGLTLVILNFFSPVIFSIQEGRYITGKLRTLAFFNQYAFYAFIAITTFIHAVQNNSADRSRYLSVFIFSISPILMGGFQVIFPEGPFYSIGFFLGCFVIYLFIVLKDKESLSWDKILSSVADIYYSMHIFDLERNKVERLLESPILKALIGTLNTPQSMIDAVMKGSVCEEYLPMVLDFVNLDTISERMKNKKHISMDFVGRNYGWTRITFISVEAEDDIQKKLIVATQIINEEKKEEIKLLFQSNNDELTGLNNRRAYEKELERLEADGFDDQLVYVSMDLNGLKLANDTLGHGAGDELLKGAADCMKKCFGLYGKVYRTGGDEFIALIKADGSKLKQIRADFEDMQLQWTGQLSRGLSVSSGYVRKTDVKSGTITDMATLADRRMYKAKSLYYKEKGIDRRGQRDAQTALFALYVKILKINITDDTYQIINMDVEEQTKENGFENQISLWLHSFGVTGQVHADDLEDYLARTDLQYLRDYFKGGKKLFSITYRRKIENVFKQVTMEIIPAHDYTHENQNLFLYVRSID